MFGARSSYDLVNPFVFHLRQRMHFGYLQDDWSVAPKLTLNLGLRYEFATPQWEDDNLLTNFDPATNTLHPGERRIDLRPRAGQPRQQQLRAARRRRLQPHREDRHPRRRTASSYVHFNRLGGENLLSFNGPHVVPITITQQPSQGLCAANQAPTTCFRPTQRAIRKA